MSTVVIMPGGFHPFHAGHLALYNSARRAFPDAEVYVAATNDTSARPFPFAVKEKLAQLAGVSADHFYQVKSPFRAEEITAKFDPEKDHLIFVRSEKDADKPPKPGTVKKDGSAGYLQPLLGAKKLEPFARHAYMAYLPTVEFGPGMTSATEIRTQWPTLDEQEKIDLVNTLYPRTQGNDRLSSTVVKMLDTAILAESVNPVTANTAGAGAGMTSAMSRRYNQPAMETTVVNDPEQGLQIRPSGGLGTWTESSLVSNLTRQIQELNRMLDSGNYQGIEYVLYRGGAMQAKIQALAALQRFKQKQGRRPIARGREIEVDEDYVEEKWSEKYKRSINCASPRGFSQRAHCAGRRKNEGMVEGLNESFSPHELLILNQYLDDAISWHELKRGYSDLVAKAIKRFDVVSMSGVPMEFQFYDRLVQARDEGDLGEQDVAEEQLDEKCWDTHRQVGMKNKGGRRVPNCVPKESSK